jgi:hypothetical protein
MVGVFVGRLVVATLCVSLVVCLEVGVAAQWLETRLGSDAAQPHVGWPNRVAVEERPREGCLCHIGMALFAT